MIDFASVPGADIVTNWFGSWPSFHDAEVTRIHLNRINPSYLDVHTFRMTSDLTPTGHYRCDKHAIVTFKLSGLIASELADFNHQNVLSGLTLEQDEDGFEITLGACYGIAGYIQAKSLSVTLTPGIPEDSIYRETY